MGGQLREGYLEIGLGEKRRVTWGMCQESPRARGEVSLPQRGQQGAVKGAGQKRDLRCINSESD